jgi:hypothetical protein
MAFFTAAASTTKGPPIPSKVMDFQSVALIAAASSIR